MVDTERDVTQAENDVDQAQIEHEIESNEEDLLEPQVKAPMSSTTKWMLVALIVVALGLAGGIGYYYYSQTLGPEKAAADTEYINNVTLAFNEYSQTQQDYFKALNDQFNAFKEKDKETHKFTAAEVGAIKGATDMFEQRATAALDAMIAVQAPSNKKKAQEEVAAAAEEVKKVVVPTTIKAQRDIKEGQTLKDFVAASEALYAEKNDEVAKVFERLLKALENAGLEMNTAPEQEGNTTETTDTAK